MISNFRFALRLLRRWKFWTHPFTYETEIRTRDQKINITDHLRVLTHLISCEHADISDFYTNGDENEQQARNALTSFIVALNISEVKRNVYGDEYLTPEDASALFVESFENSDAAKGLFTPEAIVKIRRTAERATVPMEMDRNHNVTPEYLKTSLESARQEITKAIESELYAPVDVRDILVELKDEVLFNEQLAYTAGIRNYNAEQPLVKKKRSPRKNAGPKKKIDKKKGK